MRDLSAGGVKKYHRLASELRGEIEAGVYRPGDQLPSESQLMERFAVSQNTIRAAIGVLRAEGLVVAVHGSGTFVRQRGSPRRITRTRCHRPQGDGQPVSAQPPHRIAYAGRAPAPEDIAELMGVRAGEEVIVRRSTLHEGDTDTPTELAASYLPLAVAAGTHLEEPRVLPKALSSCVEELTGRRYAKARDRLTARPPTVDEAAALGIGPANPVIRLLHAAYDEDDEILEVSESVWAADQVMIIDDYDIPRRPMTPAGAGARDRGRGRDLTRPTAWI